VGTGGAAFQAIARGALEELIEHLDHLGTRIITRDTWNPALSGREMHAVDRRELREAARGLWAQ
jgi:hypothetical protein